MRFLAALAALALFAACSTTGTFQAGSSSATGSISIPGAAPEDVGLKADIISRLHNASTIAAAGKDAKGKQCWDAGAAWVATLPWPSDTQAAETPLPEATGISGRLEIQRIRAREGKGLIAGARAKIDALRTIIRAGIPDQVVEACAVVAHDLRVDVLHLFGLGSLLP